MLAVLGAPLLRPVPASAASPRWDPRIKPIADEVAKLRGLPFVHPVPAEFLDGAAFAKRLAARSNTSASAKAAADRSASALRAFGLIGGGVDLTTAVGSLQSSNVLAYYDERSKRITVRGTELDVATKVTVAHELTHALQDQQFDLSSLNAEATRTHSTEALRALVEGDAVRIQKLFAAQLSATDRATYDTARRTEGGAALGDVRKAGVPDALTTLFEAPYSLGPSMLATVLAGHTTDAVDALFRKPPTNESSFLTPETLVDGSKFRSVPLPALHAGEHAKGGADNLGAFSLYLMLASRLDPGDALTVADGWGGDAERIVRKSGTTCYRVALVGRTDPASGAIRDALTQWSATMPAGATTVAHQGKTTILTACDQGAATPDPPSATATFYGLALAANRDSFLAALLGQGVGVVPADCIANRTVRDPAFVPVLAASVAAFYGLYRRGGRAV